MTKKEYSLSLPSFTLQPVAYKNRFDIPLLVERRIPVARQCELAGVTYFLGGLNVRDWSEDPQGYKTPEKPYVTWVQDGSANLDRSVENVRSRFVEDERGGTEFDGIALYIAHPEILENHYTDLPGTSVGPGGTPWVGLWDGEPKLDYDWVGAAAPGFGSVSCGRQ